MAMVMRPKRQKKPGIAVGLVLIWEVFLRQSHHVGFFSDYCICLYPLGETVLFCLNADIHHIGITSVLDVSAMTYGNTHHCAGYDVEGFFVYLKAALPAEYNVDFLVLLVVVVERYCLTGCETSE